MKQDKKISQAKACRMTHRALGSSIVTKCSTKQSLLASIQGLSKAFPRSGMRPSRSNTLWRSASNNISDVCTLAASKSLRRAAISETTSESTQVRDPTIVLSAIRLLHKVAIWAGISRMCTRWPVTPKAPLLLQLPPRHSKMTLLRRTDVIRIRAAFTVNKMKKAVLAGLQSRACRALPLRFQASVQLVPTGITCLRSPTSKESKKVPNLSLRSKSSKLP